MNLYIGQITGEIYLNGLDHFKQISLIEAVIHHLSLQQYSQVTGTVIFDQNKFVKQHF